MSTVDKINEIVSRYKSRREAARVLNVPSSTLHRWCNGNLPTYGSTGFQEFERVIAEITAHRVIDEGNPPGTTIRGIELQEGNPSGVTIGGIELQEGNPSGVTRIRGIEPQEGNPSGVTRIRGIELQKEGGIMWVEKDSMTLSTDWIREHVRRDPSHLWVYLGLLQLCGNHQVL